MPQLPRDGISIGHDSNKGKGDKKLWVKGANLMEITERDKRAIRRTLDRVLEQEGGLPILIVYDTDDGLCVVWTSVEQGRDPELKEKIMQLLREPDSEWIVNNHEQ